MKRGTISSVPKPKTLTDRGIGSDVDAAYLGRSVMVGVAVVGRVTDGLGVTAYGIAAGRSCRGTEFGRGMREALATRPPWHQSRPQRISASAAGW